MLSERANSHPSGWISDIGEISGSKNINAQINVPLYGD
jgi:hypothetical protein